MTQTHIKNSQTRQVNQPRVVTASVRPVVKAQPIVKTHEPIVIFSREMVQNYGA
jgi:hypothetical protein